MKFKIKSKDLRVQARLHWQPWFAWKPVRLDDYTIAWMQPVMRRLRIPKGDRNRYIFAINQNQQGNPMTSDERHDLEMAMLTIRSPTKYQWEYATKQDLVHQKLSGKNNG